MITGTVKGQSLRLSAPVIAADTINYLTARFLFSEEWDGLMIYAHFTCGSANYDAPLVNGELTEESHVNLGAGTWSVWLHGEEYSDGKLTKRITTVQALLIVKPTGTFDGEPFPSTPSEIERLHAEFDAMKRGIQADWQENDETAASYVKNRPGGYMVKQTKKTTVTVPAGEQNGDDFAAFPSFEVGDTVNITINGTEYSLVARRPDDAPDELKVALIGDDPDAETHEFGWSFFRIYTDSNNERISFVNFTDADMTVQWDSGEEDVPVKFDPKYMPEIDPKTIPDMYYTEKITDITGYSTKLSVTAEETTHDEIPFELGQTWESTNYSYGVMEVKQAIDGTLYIGDYPTMSSIPYYITRTTIKGLSQWISMMRPSGIEIVCTICGEVSKTIPDKYLPSNLFTQDNAPVKFGIGSQSAVQGDDSTALGNGSHAEGDGTNAGGYYTHAEGYSTETSGWYSHAEGDDTTASARGAHAEGYSTVASGLYSHAEGDDTVASARGAHAEGYQTTASGQYSHAEGRGTVANRYNMTASGCYNSYEDAAFIEKSVKGTTISISSSDIYYGSSSYTFDKSKGRFSLVNPERLSFSTIKSSQYVTKNDSFSTDMYYLGAVKTSTNTRKTFNATRFYGADASKTVGDYIHVVGNGNSSKRSNAYTLDWDGNGCFAGDVYVGGISKDTGAKKLITADEVYNSPILPSSTPDSTKKFKISVDDNGTISATEVTE